jgi:hypothetical protein
MDIIALAYSAVACPNVQGGIGTPLFFLCA